MARGPGKQLIYTPAIPASGSGYVNPGRIAGGAAQTVAASSSGGAGADLIRTVAGLGHDALKIVAREHEIEAQGRIEEAILSASNEFEKWKADYMQNRQGRDALSAQEDFTNKFAEIREQILKDFGYENTIFHDRLKRELTRHGLYALKDGGQYQTTQSAAWKKSVLEGKLAAFENLCANHPEDMERIDIEEQAALASWLALNPGLDPAAMRAKLANTKAVGVLSAHMAREDYEGAKALLGGGGNSSGGGTIAEDLHNPLNLKRVGANGRGRASYENYETDADGFRGAWRQLKIYKDKYGVATPKDMVERWAPASDGNNHANYFSNMKSSGMTDSEIASEIDIHNPDQAARMIKAMAVAESPLGHKYSVEQIKGFLTESTQIRKRSGNGQLAAALTPAQRITFQNQIEAAENRKQTELKVNAYSRMQDAEALANDGIIPTNIPSDAELVAAYGDKADVIIQQARYLPELAAGITSMRDKTPAEINSFLESMKPTGEKGYAGMAPLHKRLAQAASDELQAREKDPVGHLARIDKKFASARETFLRNPDNQSFRNYSDVLQSALEQRGMTAKDGMLSEADAKYFAEALQSQPEPFTLVQTLQNAAGPQFNAFMKQVAPQLSDSLKFIICMDNMPGKLLLDAARDKEFVSNNFKMNEDKFKQADFNASVLEETADFRNTLLAGRDSALAKAAVDAVTKLGLQYVNSGLSYRDAIEKASKEVCLNRYNITTVNGVKFRAPKHINGLPVDGDVLEMGAGDILEEISNAPKKLFIQEYGHLGKYQNKMYQNALRRNGYWVTNGDETGVILFMGGSAVRDKNNNIITKDWQELIKKGAARKDLQDSVMEEDD